MELIDKKTTKALQELYYWQYSYTHCFNNHLFDLIAKADSNNKAKLGMAYPEFVTAYHLWYNYPSGDQFFTDFGIFPDT